MNAPATALMSAPPPPLLHGDPPLVPPEVMPNYDLIQTEDDTPVDNLFAEKQQRLLPDILHHSWSGPGEGRPYLAMANVGLFFAVNQPPLVPDFMLSLDVRVADDLSQKSNRSYFTWVFGKSPDLVIEVVSNREGGEDDVKRKAYARIGIPIYVIHDPFGLLGAEALRAFRLSGRRYEAIAPDEFPEMGLGLTVWHGEYEGVTAEWLRWTDGAGHLLPTGAEALVRQQELVLEERQRVQQERQRAEQERQRAEQERQRADELAARLRALGVEP